MRAMSVGSLEAVAKRQLHETVAVPFAFGNEKPEPQNTCDVTGFLVSQSNQDVCFLCTLLLNALFPFTFHDVAMQVFGVTCLCV